MGSWRWLLVSVNEGAHRIQKRTSDPLELGLQEVASPQHECRENVLTH